LSAEATSTEGGLGALARGSRVVAAWVMVSRVTGFLRVAVAAAVLGPTFFGNLFQLLGTVPSLVFGMLAGSLTSAMLVPPLVRRLDAGDVAAARRLAGGALGVALCLLAGVAALGVLLAPMLLQAMTATVPDAATRQAQLRLGWPLVAVLLPQLLCYAVSAVAVAAQQARGRFALAAAAPALENLGVTAVLIGFALLHGGTGHIEGIAVRDAALLGLGVTAAVAASAGLQWWGAGRAGLTLVPRAGWRVPEIRGMLRTGLASLGTSALNCGTYLGLLVVAGSVPGGVVAYQIANSFIQLPVALTAGAASAVHLPHLARHGTEAARGEFARIYRSAAGLVLLAVLPASFVLVAIAPTLAQATAFGAMATPAGIALLGACIAARGAGAIAEAFLTIGTAASYARGDAGAPLRAMLVCSVISVLGMGIALLATAPVTRIALLAGGATVAGFVAAAWLHRAQLRGLPGLDRGDALAKLAAALAAALLAGLVARHAPWQASGAAPQMLLAVAATVLAGLTYAALEFARGSRDLALLLPVLARRAARRSGT
jgi:putative peptidoglycan lipid II flippase